LPDHPGGEKAILLYAGRDATEEFNMLHDKKVWKMKFFFVFGWADEVAGHSSVCAERGDWKAQAVMHQK
jgi:cytochrome b involved in lipid metabolism